MRTQYTLKSDQLWAWTHLVMVWLKWSNRLPKFLSKTTLLTRVHYHIQHMVQLNSQKCSHILIWTAAPKKLHDHVSQSLHHCWKVSCIHLQKDLLKYLKNVFESIWGISDPRHKSVPAGSSRLCWDLQDGWAQWNPRWRSQHPLVHFHSGPGTPPSPLLPALLLHRQLDPLSADIVKTTDFNNRWAGKPTNKGKSQSLK